MNKKQAIAYAQITLDYMQGSNYKGKLNPDTLGIEMKQTFKMYSNKVVLDIAEAQAHARRELEKAMTGIL